MLIILILSENFRFNFSLDAVSNISVIGRTDARSSAVRREEGRTDMIATIKTTISDAAILRLSC